jgi:hypothetical protein
MVPEGRLPQAILTIHPSGTLTNGLLVPFRTLA